MFNILHASPRLKQAGDKGYWYDHYRLGAQSVDRYIGPDSDELRARLDRHQALRTAAQSAGRERARLMRILRAEGFLTADVGTGQVAAAMARAGVFRLGGTLVGTQAFRLYEGELGVHIGTDGAAATNDIDIASFERLSLVLDDQVSEPLTEVFAGLKFAPVPAPDLHRVWRWLGSERQTLVEFLTPSFDAHEDLRDLPALGVSAQSLHFLNYLIAEPILVPFLYRTGELVQIPRPERFAIHKLIVADRRREGPDAQKAAKDRAQAGFLIAWLARERPEDLAEALEDARDRGPGWRRRIHASLERMPGTQAQLAAL